MSRRQGLIAPGATIGILGSGQLGRMLAQAARQMGYRVHVLSPGRDTPTGQVARAIVTVQMLFDLLFIGVAVRILGTSLRMHHPDMGPPIP